MYVHPCLADLQQAWSFRVKWLFVPLPQSLHSAVLSGSDHEFFGELSKLTGHSDHPDDDHSTLEVKGGYRFGAGLKTKYCEWLKGALDDKSWRRQVPFGLKSVHPRGGESMLTSLNLFFLFPTVLLTPTMQLSYGKNNGVVSQNISLRKKRGSHSRVWSDHAVCDHCAITKSSPNATILQLSVLSKKDAAHMVSIGSVAFLVHTGWLPASGGV